MSISSMFPLGIYTKFTSFSSSYYWLWVSYGMFFFFCFQLTEQMLLSQIRKNKLTHTNTEGNVNA